MLNQVGRLKNLPTLNHISTMSVIKNIEALTFLDAQQTETLEQRALLHRRFSNIEFKVLEYVDNVVIRVTQGKNHSGNQFDNKRLHEITVELFEGIALPDGAKLQTRPIPYKEAPTEVVTSEWLQNEFASAGVSLKQVADDTGIDITSLSAFRAAKKPISGVTKAALFYYFKWLKEKAA